MSFKANTDIINNVPTLRSHAFLFVLLLASCAKRHSGVRTAIKVPRLQAFHPNSRLHLGRVTGVSGRHATRAVLSRLYVDKTGRSTSHCPPGSPRWAPSPRRPRPEARLPISGPLLKVVTSHESGPIHIHRSIYIHIAPGGGRG